MVVIRVLLADDEEGVRDALGAVLSTAPDVEVVGVARDGDEAVCLYEHHRPDVLLLDVRMPGRDGLSAAAEVRRRCPGAKVVLLTTFGEIDYVRASVALGLNGFLLKAGDPVELIAGIRTVFEGGACLSGPIAAAVLADGQALAQHREDNRHARAAVAALPPQERRILRLVARGAPNAAIARELHLSESTVKSYLGSAFGRLGVTNRVEAALVAWRSAAHDDLDGPL